jgi:DNA transformation protein
MAVSDTFRDFVMEQLAGLGAVTSRRMFGGVGLYAEGAFFAVMDNDQVFFKVDDATRPAYQALGARPFDPMPGRGSPMMGYFEVPGSLLDDRDEVVRWARRSVGVARSAASAKPRRSRVVRETAREGSRERQLERGAKAGLTPAAILQPYPPTIRALANRLRAVVKKAAPALREAAYPGWKAVGFRHAEAGYVCGVFPSAEGVRLIFEHGAKLADPDGLLEGASRMKQVRYVTLRSAADIKVRALTRLVRAAVAHGLLRRP